MKRIVALSLCLLLSCCSARGDASSTESATPLVHANGLVVAQSEGFLSLRTERGFRFTEVGSLRNPCLISIERSRVPPPTGLMRKGMGTGEAVYRIDESDGGSGGEEYRLWAAKPVGAHWIVMTATRQGDGAAPAFTEAWRLLNRASIQGQ